MWQKLRLQAKKLVPDVNLFTAGANLKTLNNQLLLITGLQKQSLYEPTEYVSKLTSECVYIAVLAIRITLC